MSTIGRRHVMRAALAGGAVAAGVARGGAGAVAAAGPALPDVPGMLGDRRANEFWYRFDEATFYRIAPELRTAYEAIARHLGDDYEASFYETWRTLRGSAGYPENFTAHVAPIRAPLAVLSRAQLDVAHRCYRHDTRGLADAFGYFGQGVLYDPRRKSRIHTMGGDPPGGYHTWYVFMRAMMLLDIDRLRWSVLAPMNAFAWAAQTVARPHQQEANPPLPASTVRRLERRWLPRPVRRLDHDFRSFPYPPGTAPRPEAAPEGTAP
ncbi:hypothetical protein [Streptomyces ziwulingensis]|uniref:Tat pathway signal sequence domain protein n=1 Tax=Streptomyces ziwulingensis TaxID=1045501 RepID=A0ABP9BU53_9ACTN